MSDLVVELAQESEAAACLALMPDARGLGGTVLMCRRDAQLLGAAAIGWRSWSDPAGFPFTLHVLPEARRQGVGRRLVAGVLDLISGEAPGLWSLSPQEEGGEATSFLEACGFTPLRVQHFFEADVTAMLEVVEPLVRRFEARRADSSLELRPLDNAPLEEVGWLVSTEFGGGPVMTLQSLRHRARPTSAQDDERSLVAMQGDQVAGVMLCRRIDGRYVVEGRIISPAWRHGAPNLRLLWEMARRAQSEGVTRFRFHCDSDVYDTLKLARRCGAAETARKVLHYQAVTAL